MNRATDHVTVMMSKAFYSLKVADPDTSLCLRLTKTIQNTSDFVTIAATTDETTSTTMAQSYAHTNPSPPTVTFAGTASFTVS